MPAGPLRRATEALRDPIFRWWFGGQVLSTSGAMAESVGQSWLVFQMTGRALDLGLLGVFIWAPVLLGGAWAGALVDRWDRRRTLITTQLLLIAVCLLQAALVWSGVAQLWMIYGCAVLTGCVLAVDQPARHVFVLELVGAARVASAVSLYEVMFNAARVIGPAVGGLLLVTIGPAGCFAVNALSFVPTLLVLLRFRPRAGAEQARDATGSGAAAGLRYVWRMPVIRSCVLIAVAAGMLFNLAVALPLLTTEVFRLGGGGYGVMMAAFGLGAIPGALLAAAGSRPGGRRVRNLTWATGLGVLLIAMSPNPPTAFVGLLVVGMLSIWLIAGANTLVQLDAEPRMRGRVMGIWTMALPGTVPITGMLTAVVAEYLGARVGFALSGLALLATAALTWSALRGRTADCEPVTA